MPENVGHNEATDEIEREFEVCIQIVSGGSRDEARQWLAEALLAEPVNGWVGSVIGVHIDGRTWVP